MATRKTPLSPPRRSATPELATLTALAQALSGPASLSEALGAALGTVADYLQLETGWIWLIEDGSIEPRLAAARALPAALRNHPEAMRGDCYCLKTFRKGDLRGAANVNVVWCSRLEKVLEDATGANTTNLRCHASVPLAVGDRHLGMLNVASHDWRVLSDDELNLLTTAGALVSLAIERARLEAAGARAAAAEERNRLARDIHDTIAQSLAALALQLEVADAVGAAAGNDRLRNALNNALTLTRSALADARRSVLDLRAAPLDGRSLPRALQELVAGHQAPPRVDVDISGLDIDLRLPAAVEVGLFRIAQQALANALQHAHATRVEIRLARATQTIQLRIRDDGTGFDPANVPVGRFGLIGMNERARLLGGRLAIESAPGAGSVIQVDAPLPGDAPEPVHG